MSRKIFISAVSRELKSYRLLVEQSLQKRGYTPVFQELFGLTDQEIVDLLRDKIDPCDAVICLIGHAYGAEPSTPLDGQSRRSFIQLEHDFAREKSIPVYLYLTTDAIPPDQPISEADELRRLQLTYRSEVTRDRNWRSFANADQLRAEIAELRFPWERLFAPAGAAVERPRDDGADARVTSTTFSARRKTAYEELWSRIEEIHVKIRTEEVEDEAFSLLLRGMNTYIFQNSAYLDEALHDLANTYLLLLMDVRCVLTEAADEDAARAFEDTGPISYSALVPARQMRDLVEKAEGVRAELLRRVRAALDEEGSGAPKKRRWWKFW
jgi:hypothetical protein